MSTSPRHSAAASKEPWRRHEAWPRGGRSEWPSSQCVRPSLRVGHTLLFSLTSPPALRTDVTLAGYSAAALNQILDKKKGRWTAPGTAGKKAKAVHNVLPAPRAGVADAVPCGAPALSRAAAEAEADAALDNWLPPTCVSVACWLHAQGVRPVTDLSLVCGDASLFQHSADEDDDEQWEDAGVAAADTEVRDEGEPVDGVGADEGLHIAFDDTVGDDGAAVKASKPTKRPTQRKEPVRCAGQCAS